MFTVPNLITLVRILMTPFIVVELARGNYLAGGWLFGGAAFTDVLDGGLARGSHTESRFGQYFDPIADKILLSAMYIGLAAGRAVPVWLVVVIFARDLWILLLSGIALKFTTFRNLRPSPWGKVSTFAQIMAAVSITGIHAYGNAFFYRAADVLIWAVVALAAISGIDYSARGILFLRDSSRNRSGAQAAAAPSAGIAREQR